MARKRCPHCHDPACFVDRHHKYWPRRSYRTPLERAFRGLHIVRLWRCQHNLIHKTTAPPMKPSPNYMKYVVERKGVKV